MGWVLPKQHIGITRQAGGHPVEVSELHRKITAALRGQGKVFATDFKLVVLLPVHVVAFEAGVALLPLIELLGR